MRTFKRPLSMLFVELPVALVVGLLTIGAYLSIPDDTETFRGLGIVGRGTITAIDPSMRMINIDHEPIRVLNSAGMQMNFGLSPNVQISTLRIGSKIVFTLTRRDGDLYIIDAIRPTM